ncbi:hypothetical protein B4098_0541 [Heyndrickxia coagulans]|uniref:Uncharacterized protein n=1 Tax=Heyndrickxia coagulans TaxID=1398 RepID=A0A150K5M5_HEYCO|nr:hypothetical protein HMPREF3213_01425 [Heyndrickxia coagulans]KYC64867.1 hypothetical protein B4098_0541 [Heyndrickxia coagulans]KYC67327.1 hypothetical protein B4100_0558 [Heyndrickxia coagulans]KYC70533.1 hypothetical protein B4099_0647 [Heyndrickxia coagulans]
MRKAKTRTFYRKNSFFHKRKRHQVNDCMLDHTNSSFFGFQAWYYLQFCIIFVIL